MDDECYDAEPDCAPMEKRTQRTDTNRIDSLNGVRRKHGMCNGERFDSGISSYNSGNLYSSENSLRSELNEGRCNSNEDLLIPIGTDNGIDGIEQKVGSLSLHTKDNYCNSADEGFVSDLKSSDLFSVATLSSTLSVSTPEVEPGPSEPEFQHQAIFEQVFQQDVDGDTQLHTSIIQLLDNLALFFISLVPNCNFLNIRNNYLQTPLHLAVITKQPLVARKLITSGAQVDVRDHKGNSPLHIAAKEGFDVLTRVLLESPTFEETTENTYEIPYQRIPQNLEGTNYDGQVALHLAAEGAHLDVLEILLEKGANINARDGKSGRTILHYAAESGHMQLLHFLLRKPNIDINHLTYGGLTPIMLAKGRGHDNIVTLLRGAGADYDSQSDDSEEEDMNEMSYDDFKINGELIA